MDERIGLTGVEESHNRHRRLLRPRCQRPCRRRATEQRDELAPPHRVTAISEGPYVLRHSATTLLRSDPLGKSGVQWWTSSPVCGKTGAQDRIRAADRFRFEQFAKGGAG